jgi:virulence-associated protein E/bifunctional DNA primase/polymerase-like protein
MAASMPSPQVLRFFPLHGILQGACTCPLKDRCKDVGKHPCVKWRAYDENTKGSSGGYGIQTGHFNGIFVLDLDVKPDRNGVTALLEHAAGRAIPDTLSVVTPTGGVHLYFRLPPDVHVPSSRGILPGVDVRGEGGYVVGPGSPHRNGGVYREEPGELADPPSWLLELVVRPPKPELVETEHYTVDPESPEGVRAVSWARAYLARAEPAIEGQGGSDRLFAACSHLMYSALPLDVLRELVEEVYNPRCVPPWSEQEIDHKLVDADRRFDKPRGLCSPDFIDRMHGRTKETGVREPDPLHEYSFLPGMRSDGEMRKASLGEIAADLFDHKAWAGVWRFDTLREFIVATNPPMPLDCEGSTGLTNNDIQSVRLWFEFHGKKAQTQDVAAAIEAVSRRHCFNPVQDMLLSLEWDEVQRLDRVLPDYFQSPDRPYERAVGPRWFISLVARAMTPGCQSDCTLVLESLQGDGKSTAFRALMRDPTWYAQSNSGIEHKDFFENLRGLWLMGFDELASLTRAQLTKVKTVLTDVSDKYRQSYGRSSFHHLRTCGTCGSTNDGQYLNDPTGGRRFWPVKVLKEIDVSRIVSIRDQLWAEAFVRWQSGEAWHVNTPELRALCQEEQEERMEIDGWEEVIRRWMNDPTKFSRAPVVEELNSVFKGVRPFDGSQGVTTSDVLEHAVGKLKGQWTTGDAMRVGKILQHRLKMRRVRVRVRNSLEWRYQESHT